MAEQPHEQPTADDPDATAAISSQTTPAHPQPDVTTDFDQNHTPLGVTPPGMSHSVGPVQQILAGYRLERLLGEGGMGRVYRAVDPQGRAVAIKLLSARWARSDDALQRFKQEGYIASQINHPHCVFVHRVDEDRGTPFIAMELMSGRTLKDLIEQRGALPYKEAIPLILQCLDGLAEAHAQGMIHRDIKPANCYLDDQATVKIGDFGLARSLVDDSELTRSGAFLGTPLFASPEQLLGQVLDERSDIYSLSATFYYLLAGRAPFESPNAAQVIAKIASTDPPTFSLIGTDVPRGLEAIVMRGLARDRDKRFASCQELRAALLPLVTAQEEAPSLARRILAGFIDVTLVGIVLTLLTISFLRVMSGVDLGSRWPPLLTALSQSGVLFVYFWMQEAWLGCSIGKRLLRMRVVDSVTGGRPSVRQITGRTATFVLINNLIELLLVALFVPHLGWAPIIAWVSELTGWSILLTGWWLTCKRQMTHEWLSGTAIEMMTLPQRVIRSELQLPDWQPPQLALEEVPSIGRFTLCGRLDTVDGSRWYIAHDSSLDRQVWIHWHESGQPAISEERKRSTQLMRMRVIESGSQNDREWDAYLAPEGVPLAECINSNTILPWPLARQLVHQIIEHSEQANALAAYSTQLDSWRLWLSASGRVTYCEPPLRTERATPELMQPLSQPSLQPGLIELLAQIARASLPLKHRARRRQTTPRLLEPKATLPEPSDLPSYRGLIFLERLAGRKVRPEQIKYELRQLDQVGQAITSATRMAHALTTTIILFPLLALVWIMLSMTHILQVNELRKAGRQLVTLAAVLETPERYPTAWSSLSEVERTAWLMPAQRESVLTAAADRHRQTQLAYHYANSFERLVLSQVGLSNERLSAFPTAYQIESQATDNAESGTVIRPLEGVTISTVDSAAEGFSAPSLAESDVLSKTTPALRAWERGETPRNSDLPVLGFVLWPAIGIWIWTSLTGGGWLQLFTGVSALRRDGCRMSILRRAWRTFWLLAPLVLVAWWSLLMHEWGLEWGWWSGHLRMLLLTMPIGYLTCTLMWPQICPHDRLSHTIAVPR